MNLRDILETNRGCVPIYRFNSGEAFHLPVGEVGSFSDRYYYYQMIHFDGSSSIRCFQDASYGVYMSAPQFKRKLVLKCN